MDNQNPNPADTSDRVPPVVMYECKCPMTPAEEGDRDLGDEIGEVLGTYPDAAVFIAFRTPGVTTKKEARDWIKTRPNVKTGDSFHVLKPLDSIDVGPLRPMITSRGSENKPARARKPKDPNAPPAKRGRKPKAQEVPQATTQPAPVAQAVNPMPVPAPAQAAPQNKPKPVIGGRKR